MNLEGKNGNPDLNAAVLRRRLGGALFLVEIGDFGAEARHRSIVDAVAGLGQLKNMYSWQLLALNCSANIMIDYARKIVCQWAVTALLPS